MASNSLHTPAPLSAFGKLLLRCFVSELPGRPRNTVMKSTRKPGEAPDGGWGIVIVGAAFSVNLLTSLLTRCAGVMYLSWQHEFDSSASQTGAIASTMSSSSYFAGALAGVVCNRCGIRLTWIAGGLVISLASLLNFWASHLYQMYLIGAMWGTGVSFCWIPANVAVAEYFKKYYAVASGFTSAGIGSAIIVFPPVVNLMNNEYGWRGTMLIVTAISLNICVAGALYHPLSLKKHKPNKFEPVSQTADSLSTDESLSVQHCKPKSSANKRCRLLERLISEFRIWLLVRSYRFSLYCLNGLMFNILYSCFLVFLIPWAQDSGIEELKTPFLLSIMGFGSVAGRIVSGFCVTRRTPVEAVYTFSIVLCCVGVLCAQAQSYEAFAASACLLGIGTGVNKALSFVLLRKLVGLHNVASGVGVSYLCGGVGDLLGPIFAGVIYDATGAYTTVFYVLAGLSSATALQMLLLPLLKRIEPGLDLEKYEQTSTQV